MSATERPVIGIRELRQNASKYVAMVEQGTDVYIARRGDIVAQMVPLKHKERDPLQDLYDSGLLRPPEDPGSVLDVVPVRASSEISLSDLIVQTREEERF